MPPASRLPRSVFPSGNPSNPESQHAEDGKGVCVQAKGDDCRAGSSSMPPGGLPRPPWKPAGRDEVSSPPCVPPSFSAKLAPVALTLWRTGGRGRRSPVGDAHVTSPDIPTCKAGTRVQCSLRLPRARTRCWKPRSTCSLRTTSQSRSPSPFLLSPSCKKAARSCRRRGSGRHPNHASSPGIRTLQR